MTAVQIDALIESFSAAYFRGKGVAVPANMGKLLAAQARHETANYTSNVFRRCNNLFGYKRFPGSPWQMGVGTAALDGGNFALYVNYSNSIGELCAYWLRVKSGTNRTRISYLGANPTVEDYCKLLKSLGYFMEPWEEYAAGMSRAMGVLAPAGGGSTADLAPVVVRGQSLSTEMLILLLAAAIIL